jgi:hypothetical protein
LGDHDYSFEGGWDFNEEERRILFLNRKFLSTLFSNSKGKIALRVEVDLLRVHFENLEIQLRE